MLKYLFVKESIDLQEFMSRRIASPTDAAPHLNLKKDFISDACFCDQTDFIKLLKIFA